MLRSLNQLSETSEDVVVQRIVRSVEIAIADALNHAGETKQFGPAEATAITPKTLTGHHDYATQEVVLLPRKKTILPDKGLLGVIFAAFAMILVIAATAWWFFVRTRAGR